MRPLQHSLALLTLCAWVALSVVSPNAQGQTLQIDPIKASYLDGFLDFVRWDGEVKNRSATIGVMGSRELYSHLERLAREKTTGRSLKIVQINPGDDVSQLEVLFVAAGHRRQWEEIAEACCRHKVLLVGDEEGFARQVGGIEFVVRKNRLRFRISIENTRRCGIEISSKLAEMAMEQI